MGGPYHQHFQEDYKEVDWKLSEHFKKEIRRDLQGVWLPRNAKWKGGGTEQAQIQKPPQTEERVTSMHDEMRQCCETKVITEL